MNCKISMELIDCLSSNTSAVYGMQGDLHEKYSD